MFQQIIVGCDDSPRTGDAIALAMRLRDPLHGRLVLANVFPFFRNFAFPVGPAVFALAEQQKANALLAELAAQLPAGVPHALRAVTDPSAASGLRDLAEDVAADLIVLGPTHLHVPTRGTVEQLLGGAPCALAVAAAGHAPAVDRPRVVAAFDGSPEARAALATAFAVARGLRATVEICRVFKEEPEPQAATELDEAVAGAPEDVPATARILRGDPSEAITEAARDADLVVAGSRGRGTLRRIVGGSVSEDLLTGGRAAVLVVVR